MDVQLSSEVEAKVAQTAMDMGCPANAVVETALLDYFDRMTGIREMLDSRYSEMVSGAVTLIDGPTFFEELRRREEAMISGSVLN